MARIFPTLRQIVLSTIAGIASHPRIQKPNIYYPVTGFNEQPKEVLIERYRTYDGIELEEPGLTCSVFPMYTSHTFKNAPTARGMNKSVTYTPYTLGPQTGEGFNYEAVYTIIVQLSYQDVAINESVNVPITSLHSPLGLTLPTPHQDNYQIPLDYIASQSGLTQPPLYSNSTDISTFTDYSTVEIQINPAEEIFREYMELIRIVLDDMPKMRPWFIRSSHVKSIDYPTTSWNRQNTDVYFHMAWLAWELSIYPPGNWRDLKTVETIHLDRKMQS